MRVWTIANQKGGVGKTTTVVTMGGILSERGEPTLMLDMDPHGSLTSYFGLDPDELEKSIYSLFQCDLENMSKILDDILVETRFENLYLLPASTAMAALDRQMGTKGGKGLVIQQLISSLGGRFSNILIDCPPNLGILMINAMAACDQLIIPVQTEFLSLKGLERMLRTIEMMSNSRKSAIPYSILPTMFDKRTRASLVALRNLRNKYEKELSEAIIPVDTRFREASRMGVPLSVISRNDKGVLAYKKFIKQLLSTRNRDKCEIVRL